MADLSEERQNMGVNNCFLHHLFNSCSKSGKVSLVFGSGGKELRHRFLNFSADCPIKKGLVIKTNMVRYENKIYA